MDCIFCQIIQKKSSAFIVDESEQALAFLDLFPLTPGHTLFVPKVHQSQFFKIDSSIIAEIFQMAQRISQILTKLTVAEDFNFFASQGKIAGQEVFHAHFHLLPRKKNDHLFHFSQNRMTLTAEELQQMQKLLIES